MELYVHNIKGEKFDNPIEGKFTKPKLKIFFKNEYLPNWFLEEIFLRLPVKCVFRYKCVSKQWLSLISAPSFVSLYISRASLLPQQTPIWTILANTLSVNNGVNYFAQSYLPDLLSDNRLHPRFCTIHFPYVGCPEDERYAIVAVSDGLVLYDRGGSDYRIYNAITGDCIALPPPSMSFERVSTGFITESEGGSLRSFKVVRFDCQFGESYILKFEIFLSETGSWRSLVVHNDVPIEVVSLRRPVSLNGNLHWIDRRLGIMAFDPSNDLNQCRVIELHDDIDKQCNDARNNGSPTLCDVHQGRLRYIEVSLVPSYPFGFSGFSVWVLDDYDSSNWSLQHRVKIRDIVFDDISMSKALTGLIPTPIAFHPLDANILYLGFGDAVVSYNMKTLKLDVVAVTAAQQNSWPKAGTVPASPFSRLCLGDPDDVPVMIQRLLPCWSSAFLFMLPAWPISLPIDYKGLKK
ncbi:putative F-box/kelch-repeat protein At1g15680 [Nicotiana tabacum]|uniref:F-box/kelch-repeat protein At1g15680 n=1 Tax=Nicotiana tabacum TaxID=4097 RepID=A0A1S3Z3T1_TOBAC|nr:PREDICTED: putative F-box/kelch-repeat protein At1g15680 [Nicotiana tabacum]